MPQRHHHLLTPALIAGALLLAGAVIGAVMLLSGFMTTAATRQHFYLTHRVLEAGLSSSIRAHAKDIAVPPLDDPQLAQTGLACYRDHCAQCHGAPGVAPGPAALGLLPIPASLVQTAREWPPESLYYVTRKGVRMTGMPAWEMRLSERSLWATVAFMRTLPDLDASTYRRQLAALQARCEARTDLPDLPPQEMGDILLRQYGCHACHVIDGVVGPRSFTGPPLRAWAKRGFIAGVLPNTPANLAQFIGDPQQFSPATLMPDLDVPPRHAAAMAAFLFAQR
jgi:mono/diheme cytochrome c family protein